MFVLIACTLNEKYLFSHSFPPFHMIAFVFMYCFSTRVHLPRMTALAKRAASTRARCLQNARRHSCFFQNKQVKSETREESDDQIFYSLRKVPPSVALPQSGQSISEFAETIAILCSTRLFATFLIWSRRDTRFCARLSSTNSPFLKRQMTSLRFLIGAFRLKAPSGSHD